MSSNILESLNLSVGSESEHSVVATLGYDSNDKSETEEASEQILAAEAASSKAGGGRSVSTESIRLPIAQGFALSFYVSYMRTKEPDDYGSMFAIWWSH